MKQRDREAVSTFRNALARLDNASAVPLREEHRAGAIEAARVGVGSADEARHELTEAETMALLREEVRSLRADAAELDDADATMAARVRRQALLLEHVLEQVPGSSV